jgi:hypothetical protein
MSYEPRGGDHAGRGYGGGDDGSGYVRARGRSEFVFTSSTVYSLSSFMSLWANPIAGPVTDYSSSALNYLSHHTLQSDGGYNGGLVRPSPSYIADVSLAVSVSATSSVEPDHVAVHTPSGSARQTGRHHPGEASALFT